MAEIHKLLEQHGKAGVLTFDVDRRVVEAAAGYMSSEENEVGFLYSGWAQSALPHKSSPTTPAGKSTPTMFPLSSSQVFDRR